MNVYIHFPFCRSKCAYCALHSHVGRSNRERDTYVANVAHELEALLARKAGEAISTLYFGGGTPTLCNLEPMFDVIRRACAHVKGFEFTVELNPADASPDTLRRLMEGGVNRISIGVQSFDDSVLRGMGRPHTASQAVSAWRMIREAGFRNAGIDLICGWPGKRDGGGISDAWRRTIETAVSLDIDHCSVYTLILEPKTRLAADFEAGRVRLPSDDDALAELAVAQRVLGRAGLERYEISSFSKPGMECRHNLATWRGEDYIGIGDGACSREGNAVSRVIFRLRLLKEGLNPAMAADEFPELAPRVPGWVSTLDRFASEGLLSSEPSHTGSPTYRLTERGTEVCDAILAELV